MKDVSELLEAKRRADAVRREAEENASSARRALEEELEDRQVALKLCHSNTQAVVTAELRGDEVCLAFSIRQDQRPQQQFTIAADGIVALRDYLNELLPPADQAEISSTA